MIFSGISHFDTMGSARLEKLLDFYKPRKITVEVPENMTIYEAEEAVLCIRRSDAERMGTMKKPRKIPKSGLPEHKFVTRMLVDYGVKLCENSFFDIVTAAEYKRRTNAEVIPVDSEREYGSVIGRVLIEFARVSSEIDTKVNPTKTLYDFAVEEIAISKRIYSFDFYERLEETIDYMNESLNRMVKKLPMFIPMLESARPDGSRERNIAKGIQEIRPDMHIGGFMHGTVSVDDDETAGEILRRNGVEFDLVPLSSA